MCLIVRILYKFNTVEAFERAVGKVEDSWSDKHIQGRVIYNKTKRQLHWQNVREELNRAITANPGKIHGLISVENQ
jgi:hypothetical protein